MSLATHALSIAEAADHRFADHGRSVAELAGLVAEELRLEPEARQELELAALLHDIGKLAIPDHILDKPSSLTATERSAIERHTTEGEALLVRAEESLSSIARIVRSSHERWDGTGYPDGLNGLEIPLAARIVFCCDSYDAMTSDRPYRKAVSHARAIAELWEGAGTQFDPSVVAAVARVLFARRARTGDRGRTPADSAEAGASRTAPLASGRAISG